MMPEVRLIDANAAADKIMRETEARADEIGVGGVALMIGFARALRDETNFPTIEAEPVRHGRWINDTFCSECNRFPVDVSFNVSNQKLAKYFSRCPHCGAKMDGGEENA